MRKPDFRKPAWPLGHPGAVSTARDLGTGRLKSRLGALRRHQVHLRGLPTPLAGVGLGESLKRDLVAVGP